MGHDIRLPAGQRIARILRQVFARQRAEVMSRLARGLPSRVDLSRWTQPMVELLTPLVVTYYHDGAYASGQRIRRALREHHHERASGVRAFGGGRLSGADGEIAAVDPGKDRQRLADRAAEGISTESGRSLFGGRTTDSLRRAASSHSPQWQAGDSRPVPTHRAYRVKDASRDAIGLAFDVFNQKVLTAAQAATLQFCEATNDTSTMLLSRALEAVRGEISEGLERGDPYKAITEAVQAIFADPMRARRIAVTEATRAVHGGQVLLAKATGGLVKGKQWLCSADACDKCLAIDGKIVGLDEPFAVEGTGPYAVIYHPPYHVSCYCAMLDVLDLKVAA